MKNVFAEQKRISRSFMLGLIGAAGLVVGVWAGAAGAFVCGPGPHWVDTCPSGFDTFNSLGFETVEIFGVGTFSLQSWGPTTVWRGTPAPGSSAGGDSHIDTEMVSLALTGGGLTLIAGDGIGNGSSDGPLYSPGRIDETSNPNFAASFFDIFFQLQGSPFGPLHNVVPAHMSVLPPGIPGVPPPIGTTYFCDDIPGGVCNTPIVLYDSDNVPRARLISAIHIVPEPSTILLFGSGLVALLGYGRRRAKTA